MAFDIVGEKPIGTAPILTAVFKKKKFYTGEEEVERRGQGWYDTSRAQPIHPTVDSIRSSGYKE